MNAAGNRGLDPEVPGHSSHKELRLLLPLCAINSLSRTTRGAPILALPDAGDLLKKLLV